MMGPSGGGKSTWIEANAENLHGYYEPVVICSSDDYPGLYDDKGFHPELLGNSHPWCLRKFDDACIIGAPTVVCDNTNTTIVEIAPYIAIAQARGYEVRVILCDVDDLGSCRSLNLDKADACAERNKHSVPLEAIERQRSRMYHMLWDHWPRFWPRVFNSLGKQVTR